MKRLFTLTALLSMSPFVSAEVHQPKSMTELAKLLNSNQERLTLFNLSLTYCGLCKTAYPTIKTLRVQNPDVCFIKIEIDQLMADMDDNDLQQIVKFKNITGAPTFLLFKKDVDAPGSYKEVGRVMMSDAPHMIQKLKQDLQAIIDRHKSS